MLNKIGDKPEVLWSVHGYVVLCCWLDLFLFVLVAISLSYIWSWTCTL